MESYKTPEGIGTGEITEKKSRFIATVKHVESEEEAVAFIAEMKKKYWDARHNCSAYIIGTEKPLERCSDDGEPSRTAGMPMLDILKGEGLYDVVAVVTRYFGGILLGTGGLVRAYQASLKEGLLGTKIVTRKYLNKFEIVTDYNGYGRLQYFAAQENATVVDTVFAEDVRVTLIASDMVFGSISKKMTEATAGKCIVNKLGCEYVTVL